MVVWSEDGNIQSEHLLLVLCVFQEYRNRVTVRLKKAISKAQNKFHGEGRCGIHQDKVLHKREIRDILIAQNVQSLLLVRFHIFHRADQWQKVLQSTVLKDVE